MNDQVVDVGNAKLAPRAGYTEVLEEIIARGHCPFCEEHLSTHHTRPILWTTDHWIVTTNGWPYRGTRLHFLLIARQHVERIEDTPDEARLDFFNTYERIVERFGISGATLMWRSGDTSFTGATVKHLHAQIVVGYEHTKGCDSIIGLLGFQAPL